jgi:recombination protein RecR
LDYPASVERLMQALQSLPTIGPKSAGRLAFHLLNAPPEQVRELADAMLAMRAQVQPCPRCGNLAEGDLCRVCSDVRRDPAIICVVGDAREVAAVEKTREFRGLYHVLGGLISPLDGVGPEQLRVRELMNRLNGDGVQEVILATTPTVPGEATALYLHRQLAGRVRVTRLALGLPVGSDLEYADEVTLGRALSGRRDMP